MEDKLVDEKEGRVVLGGVGKTTYWKILNEISAVEPDGIKKIGRLTRARLSALRRHVERCPNYISQMQSKNKEMRS